MMNAKEIQKKLQWELDGLVEVARAYNSTFVKSERHYGKHNGYQNDRGTRRGLMWAARRIYQLLHPERVAEYDRRYDVRAERRRRADNKAA